MYQPLIKFHPYPAIITQVLRIFVIRRTGVDPFGDILTIRGRSVALSVTHFRKIYDLQ